MRESHALVKSEQIIPLLLTATDYQRVEDSLVISKLFGKLVRETNYIEASVCQFLRIDCRAESLLQEEHARVTPLFVSQGGDASEIP